MAKVTLFKAGEPPKTRPLGLVKRPENLEHWWRASKKALGLARDLNHRGANVSVHLIVFSVSDEMTVTVDRAASALN
jgi:hypothetical protein